MITALPEHVRYRLAAMLSLSHQIKNAMLSQTAPLYASFWTIQSVTLSQMQAKSLAVAGLKADNQEGTRPL